MYIYDIIQLSVSLHQERVRVVLHCGTADCARHGQVSIYEEGRGTGNSASQPSRVIPSALGAQRAMPECVCSISTAITKIKWIVSNVYD